MSGWNSDGGPAFPVFDASQNVAVFGGMSLRDWFAGQAIGAVVRQCATDVQFNGGSQPPEEYFAMKAYTIADAMIAARKAGA